MMTGNEPVVQPMRRYSINEAAEALGIHLNTLRRYAKEGGLKAIPKKRGKGSVYLGKDLLSFWRTSL